LANPAESVTDITQPDLQAGYIKRREASESIAVTQIITSGSTTLTA
jgi:hypothetical protein